MSNEGTRPVATPGAGPGDRIVASAATGVFGYFFRLGFVNIGGPVAQLAMMYDHAVERARWVDRERFLRVVGVCHILPGPEALQLAIYLGYLTRGRRGGIFAGVMFILPGAVLITVLAAFYAAYGSVPLVTDALAVLKPAILGIIVAGLLRIARAALRSWTLVLIAAFAFAALRAAAIDPVLVLVLAGAAAVAAGRRPSAAAPVALLLGPGLPIATLVPLALSMTGWLDFVWAFLRTGAFSFGGAYGSIALLTRGVVVEHGWLTSAQLLDGVAISIATPGPFMLFATWAGYLIAGVPGAAAATLLVFLPSFILVLAAARHIEIRRERPAIRRALDGVTAAVVAVILLVTFDLAPAALVDPLAGAIALLTFGLVIIAKRDVALVSVGAMVAGVATALIRGWTG